MRHLPLFLSLLALPSFGAAQEPDTSLLIGQLPTCALSCLVTAVVNSPCDLTNLPCLCNDHGLQSKIVTCVVESCTLKQSLTTKNITATACHAPIRYKEKNTRATNIALTGFNGVLLAMRITYQASFSGTGFGWDDYSVLVAYAVGIPSVIVIDVGALPSGLGRDVWTLRFKQITDFARWLYILELFYVFQLTLLKLTLLLFLLRIFQRKATRRLLWATVAFNLVWGFAFLLATVFQCQPISSLWTSWDEEHTRKCINVNALCWTHAIISIILDLWMLAVPLYEVSQLQMSWRKKFNVTIMFCVGTLVTVVSILRLQSLVVFAAAKNPTLDQSDVFRWTSLEINIGMTCASLPALRKIIGHGLSKLQTSPGISKLTYSVRSQRKPARKHMFSLGSDLESTTLGEKGLDTVACAQDYGTAPGEGDQMVLLQLGELAPMEPKARITSTDIVVL